jgi:hypothetical protein
LRALARAPARGLSTDELFRAIWGKPERELSHVQQAARVRRVVSLLRTAGLAAGIDCARGRYALAPSVRIGD